MNFTVPYPPKTLNPNTRTHWGTKNRVAQKYKNDCYLMAKSVKPKFTDKDIYLSLIFHPGKVRRRDLDNCLASFKAGLDGISAAWGIDDSRFKLLPAIGEVKKLSCVAIEILDGIPQDSKRTTSAGVP